jgi:hypothetical protein
LHEVTEENNESPRSRLSPSRDLNVGPPKYEAGVLTSRPRRSVDVIVTNGHDLAVVVWCRRRYSTIPIIRVPIKRGSALSKVK